MRHEPGFLDLLESLPRIVAALFWLVVSVIVPLVLLFLFWHF